jgi:hypothetical protein
MQKRLVTRYTMKSPEAPMRTSEGGTGSLPSWAGLHLTT